MPCVTILAHRTRSCRRRPFTMDVYAHSIPSMQENAMDLVSGLIWGTAVDTDNGTTTEEKTALDPGRDERPGEPGSASAPEG